MTTIAVIGGTGLYEFNGLTDLREHRVDTPFGPPSDDIIEGRLQVTRLLFLARHGKGHRLLPSEVNYRANIFALKALGADQLVSVSAVGSMQEEIRPGHLVVVEQYIDRTWGRPSTFFGNGIAGHVAFADPACPALSARLFDAASSLCIPVHRGKTLMVMEGPAFSTRAESRMHRQLGVDLIGMTAMPEAKLAREAELCYATLALSTDYDCWREGEQNVSVDTVVAVLQQNAHNARAVIKAVAAGLPAHETCDCQKALDLAIITDRQRIPSETKNRMQAIFGRVL